MPPQIKHDLNQAGWEASDFPSVCESCLSENPMVKMLKEDHGAECKLCTRPFTLFTWSTNRANGGKKSTIICLSCARVRNSCQCCMLDLSFGLPLAVRDAGLQMVSAGPRSDINREHFAQHNDHLLGEGLGTEQYGKTVGKARELLRKLATSKPYFRKGRVVDEKEIEQLRGPVVAAPAPGQTIEAMTKAAKAEGPPDAQAESSSDDPLAGSDVGSRVGRGRARRSGRNGRRGSVQPPQAPPNEKDWLPPQDRTIMSLFITGVEDDLPEFKIRDYFRQFGKIRSMVCSHMSHCAFINFETREAAERAADQLRGRVLLSGCPLRVRWGNPKPIGLIKKEQRDQLLADARIKKQRQEDPHDDAPSQTEGGQVKVDNDKGDNDKGEAGKTVPLPPGQEQNVAYSSLAGEQ